jgi:hypothetical protein
LTAWQDASLADITYLFESGALVDFTSNELIHLILALFSDTPLRRDTIAKIHRAWTSSQDAGELFTNFYDTVDDNESIRLASAMYRGIDTAIIMIKWFQVVHRKVSHCACFKIHEGLSSLSMVPTRLLLSVAVGLESIQIAIAL